MELVKLRKRLCVARANQALRLLLVNSYDGTRRPVSCGGEYLNGGHVYAAGSLSDPPRTHTAPTVRTDPLEQSEKVGAGICTRI